jgi:hypothetical protein
MDAEVVTKFKKGDRVVVVDEDSWCNGCHGTVKGVWSLPKGMPYYLVHLDESPSPVIQNAYIYEPDLKKEE